MQVTVIFCEILSFDDALMMFYFGMFLPMKVISCTWAGVGSAWLICKVHQGSTVAVFGLGTIGLAVSVLNIIYTFQTRVLKYKVEKNDIILTAVV